MSQKSKLYCHPLLSCRSTTATFYGIFKPNWSCEMHRVAQSGRSPPDIVDSQFESNYWQILKWNRFNANCMENERNMLGKVLKLIRSLNRYYLWLKEIGMMLKISYLFCYSKDIFVTDFVALITARPLKEFYKKFC